MNLFKIAIQIASEKPYTSPYKHWTNRERARELGRMNSYIMDMDADGIQPEPRIQKILDLNRKLTPQEEDVLIAWSESNTPGFYQSGLHLDIKD